MFLFAWLHHGLSAAGVSVACLQRFAVVTLGRVAAGVCLALFRALRGRRFRGELKGNMLGLFPEQRKDLDAWFAQRVVGTEHEAVKTVIERRLARTLPGRCRLRMGSGPVLGLPACALAALAVLVVAAATPKQSLQVTRRYVGRLFGTGGAEPLQVVAIGPQPRSRKFSRPVKISRRAGMQGADPSQWP